MSAIDFSSYQQILPSRKSLINRLLFLTDYCEEMVLLSGEKGLGKSTVLEYFLELAYPEANKVYLKTNAYIEDDEARTRIVEQLFGNQLFDLEDSLVTLYQKFNQTSGQRVLIIIDDAHLLSKEVLFELSELVSLNVTHNQQISVILGADCTSSKLSLLTDFSVVVQIEALNLTESNLLVGHDEYNAIAEDIKKASIQEANGNPQALVDLLIAELKLQVPANNVNKKHSRIMWLVTLVSVFVLTLAAVFYFYDGFSKTDTQDVTSKNVTVKTDSLNSKSAQSSRLPSEKEVSSLSLGNEEKITQPSTSRQENSNDESSKKESTKTESSKKESTKTESNDVLDELAADWNTDNSRSDKVETITSVESQAQLLTESTDPVISENQLNSPAIVPEVNPQTITDDIRVITFDNEEVLGTPKSFFTIQLTGLSSEQLLSEYINYHALTEQFKIYKSKKFGSSWYVVIYGKYNTIEEARADIINLPEGLKQGSPWAKSYASIHDELNKQVGN